MGTITIEIDERDALVRHVEDLQRVITKRNETIQQLTDRLEAGEGSEYVQKAYEKGKREGWTACSQYLMNATNDAARALGQVSKEAFKLYADPTRGNPSTGENDG